MKNVSRILPCYSADTAGVCSALYELGGLVAVHDASGCNSTYATHDEPRWETLHAPIFISAMNEMDAIMGNDERFIADVTAAAHDLHPNFIAVCGSPMPVMTGTDFDAAAAEIEQRAGIRTFALHTNGMRPYIDGASEAFAAVVREYVQERPKADGIGVNLLGMTPLDLPWHGTVPKLKAWLAEHGFSCISCISMDSSFEELQRAAQARVNLVLSVSCLAAAEYLAQKFGMPYVCGVPVKGPFAAVLADALREAVRTGQNAAPCAADEPEQACAAVIGEAVLAGSIAQNLHLSDGTAARVICPLPDAGLTHHTCLSEEETEAALAAWQPETVYADPLYRYILPKGTNLIPVPHFAFSGRCCAGTDGDII